MIERILPASVATAEEFSRNYIDVLFPDGDGIIASEGSSGEFSATRACARAALGQLPFLGEFSLISQFHGAPRWPTGMTGSTTYCAGYRAVAVALTRDVVSLGVDAELNETLPDDDMLDLIASREERKHLDRLAARIPGICWDRLLFSAKLSAYKTWFPLESWWLNLKLANIVINAYEGTFTAELLAPGPVVGGAPVTEMCGRWLAHEEILVTAVVVPVS